MSEGHNFEKQETSPQPKVDVRSILESGEIVQTHPLEGCERYEVATIKDDGMALFRSESDKSDEESFMVYRRLFRNDLELLAFKVDEILGFNLVPPVVRRFINGQSGTLQQFKESAKVASNFRMEHWSDLVDHSEIIKAAVFDYLIEAKDRSDHNFMIDKTERKLWLIDHDYYMLIEWSFGSDILRTAISKGLIELPEEIKKAIGNLLEKIDSILDLNAKPEVKSVLRGIKVRAEDLIATGLLT